MRRIRPFTYLQTRRRASSKKSMMKETMSRKSPYPPHCVYPIKHSMDSLKRTFSASLPLSLHPLCVLGFDSEQRLIFEDNVKSRLLNYMKTVSTFGDHGVDKNIISWNSMSFPLFCHSGNVFAISLCDIVSEWKRCHSITWTAWYWKDVIV